MFIKMSISDKIKSATCFTIPAVVAGVYSFKQLMNYFYENYSCVSDGVFAIPEACARARDAAVFSSVGAVAFGTIGGVLGLYAHHIWKLRQEQLAQESREKLRQRTAGAWDLKHLK